MNYVRIIESYSGLLVFISVRVFSIFGVNFCGIA